MQWISCHPNEAEFGFSNQHIPIKSTTNYAQTDDEKIDILMQQLMTFEKEFTSKKQFYQHFQDEWFDKVLAHPLLYKETAIKGKDVSQRFFEIFDVATTFAQVVSITSGRTQVQGNSILVASNFGLKAWDSATNKYGCLQIKCTGTLLISKYGQIDGDECGYSSEFGKEWTYSSGYREKTLNVLHYGSPKGNWSGGGIIGIIAERIINGGKISCCSAYGASGGSIKLMAKSITNYGEILAKGGVEMVELPFITKMNL